ncbi:MAG: beta-lactamase family protein [Flavobacteriales bacterium]|nr:beta-lactamase family protein [Flavobacteriales bacterium]
MMPFHYLRVLIAIAILLCHATSNAQVPNATEQHQVIRTFYNHYQNDDYRAMRKQMNWLMRLVLPTSSVKGLFEGDKMMFGQPEIVDITNRSPKSVSVKIKFSNDTTEVMEMGYSISDKNKIIGIRKSGVKMIFPRKPQNKSLDERLASIDSLVQLKKNVTKFNGCVLVIEDGKTVYKACIGESDYTTHAPLNDSSVFELASCSKQFTAIAILMLFEEGKLDLEDPITKYIPELPYKDVRIRHLLNHTGGLPDYMELMDKKWDKTKIAFNSDLIACFAKYKPKVDFKAGEKHEYSNTGYAVLSTIIERASGMSYEDFMMKKIFKPLGMDHSRIYNTRRSSSERVVNYAYGYVYDTKNQRYDLPDNLPEQDVVFWLDGITGDGTVNSCIRDLALWEKALRSHQLISENTTLKAMSNTHLDSGEKVEYGYGWAVHQDDKNQHIAYHTGSWPGYITMIIHFMETDRSVIILSNNEYYFIEKMGAKMADIMSR